MPIGAWVVPAIMAGGQLLSTALQNHAAKKRTAEMNAYNSPAAQMRRYQKAGLNPNLIYSQGTPGNQSAPAPTQGYHNVTESLPLYNQTRMVDSQVQAQNAATVQKLAAAELANIQAKVAAANPLLDQNYLDALVSSMQSAAEIKAADSAMTKMKSDWYTGKQSWNVDGKEMHGPAGAMLLEMELKNIMQKFDLGTQDKAIKAEILKSKEFQNEILEVQKRFMTNGDITPQHILQFVQLLLMKML